MEKVFLSTNQQLKILRARGLVIANGSRAKRIIEMENYYNLINGYKELFLDKTTSKDQGMCICLVRSLRRFMRCIYSTGN